MREPSSRGGRSVAFTLLAALGASPLTFGQDSAAQPPVPDTPGPQASGTQTSGTQTSGTEAPPLPDVAPDGPWRLGTALKVPDWLKVGGTIRGRFEHTDERFRLNQNSFNQIFVLRSLLALTIQDEILEVTGELQDSRAYGIPDNRLINATSVNAVELLQGYVAARFTDAFSSGDSLRVQLGRHTMDNGSRRFVARNRYRNTINSFLGLNAQWNSRDTSHVRAFFTHYTVRLPSALEQDRIQDNDIEFDEEFSENTFFGVFGSESDLALNTTGELFYYGLERTDVLDLAVADRELHTIGGRWFRPRARGDWFWELEGAYQFGDSRNARSATEDLDHKAYFVHASAGYEFDADWRPRLEGLFDIASGDDDPDDGENNRYDTLFGARRFEFGPTGIFGAFARSNLLSPGLRFVSKPAKDWEFMFTHRFHYLESDTDAWVTTGLRDPDGNSGSHIGNLTEFRVRYDIEPKSLLLEFGAAYLDSGSFVERVGDGENSLYSYVQMNFTF